MSEAVSETMNWAREPLGFWRMASAGASLVIWATLTVTWLAGPSETTISLICESLASRASDP